MERPLILGIDAGSSRVAAALAELEGGSAKLVGTGMVPCTGVRKGVVVDLAAVGKAMELAVQQAAEMAGRPAPTRAVLSISGAHLRSVVGRATVPVARPSSGVAPEDVRRALDAAAEIEPPQGRQVVHVVPRSYRLDEYEGIVDPLGLAGRELHAEVHLITGDSLSIQNYLRAAQLAGLEVADFLVGIRAAGEALLTPEEQQHGVLLLDVGATTTGVAVYDKGYLLHIAVLPVGGEHITSDLATLKRIPVALAETIKLERGWASSGLCPDAIYPLPSPSGQVIFDVPEKEFAEIIESRVQELLELAANSVKQSGYTGLFPGGLVLTGGGSRLNGLLQVASDCLGLPARLGAPSSELASEPEHAVAVGLTQWGARLVRDEAVVAAAEEEERDKWGRLKNWLRGLFG